MQGNPTLSYSAESPNDWFFDRLAHHSAEQTTEAPRHLGRFAIIRTRLHTAYQEIRQRAHLRRAAVALGCAAGAAALISPQIHNIAETLPQTTLLSEQEISNHTLNIATSAISEINTKIHYDAAGIDLLYYADNELGVAIQLNVCPPASGGGDRLAPHAQTETAPQLQALLQAHLGDVPFALQSVCLSIPPTLTEANPAVYPCLQTGTARQQWRSLCLEQTKVKKIRH